MTQRRPPAEPDSVDSNLEVWARELPFLDLETEGIVERIYKLERHIDRTMRETLEAFDLSHGEWRLMAHLRYAGPPYRGQAGQAREAPRALERRDDEPPRQHRAAGPASGGSTTPTTGAA